MPTKPNLPIGVFDSGVGGLTVLRALHQALPNEQYLYLGDTARLPYGTKGADTITRYAMQATTMLIERGIKMLIVACNTVTAVCLPQLRETFAELPIVGVVEPGATAAVAATKSGHIAVIATEATVNTEGYQRAIKYLLPEAVVLAQGCGLLVPLAEEGWTEGDIAEAILRRYLDPILHSPENGLVDCLVLGCTHYPTLLPAIQKVVGTRMKIIDSAKTTAEVAAKLIQDLKLATSQTTSAHQRDTFLVTDTPARFTRVAAQFLGQPIADSAIELVEMSGKIK